MPDPAEKVSEAPLDALLRRLGKTPDVVRLASMKPEILGDFCVGDLRALLSTPPSVDERQQAIPELETEAMQDAARGILQILRGKPGATEHDVYLWCKGRGDDLTGLHENSGEYVTEARAAAMIYRAMIRALSSAPKAG